LRTPRALLLALLLAAPATLVAQSAYVPLDDVAYVYVDALIARGQLRSLSALERPYTVQAIRRAAREDFDRQRERPISREIRALRNRLSRAVSKYGYREPPPDPRGGPPPSRPFRAQASAGLWVTGETSGQRELMRADDLHSTAFAGGAFRFLMTAGPVVGFSRPILENRLNTDPDFAGRTDRRIAGRMEDAYVAAQWRYAELFFGRVGRNWGPAPLQGLMLSNAPFTYDHLFGRLGGQRLNISVLLARLDNDSIGLGNEVNRYLAAHRFAVRWRGFEAAIAESFLYAGQGRTFEPSLANPFTIYGLNWRNEKIEGNLLVTGQLAARTRLGLFSGELLIDDIQIDRCDPTCREPSSYGLTLTAEGVPAPLGQRFFGSYTRVSSLTYRTPLGAERYTSFDVSLGRAFSDYDEWKVGADVALGDAPLRGYFASRRQGAGDYRTPFPPEAAYATQPGIFEGEMTRVRRLGLSGGLVVHDFDVRGDIGHNWVNAPASSSMASGFEGRVRVSWNPSWAVLRLPVMSSGSE
jgi:hypothetical protein